ncbi:MAG: hypothetical protein RR745_01850 [Bacilli bacterium]
MDDKRNKYFECFQMNILNIKNNKLHYFFVFSIIILTMFSVITFDFFKGYKDETSRQHLEFLVDNNEEFIDIKKSNNYFANEMTKNYTKLLKDDNKQIKNVLSNINIKGHNMYEIGTSHIESNDIMMYQENLFEYFNGKQNFFDNDKPYNIWSEGFSIVEWENDEFPIEITGRMPVNNNEIVISNYIADLLMQIGLNVYGEEKLFYPNNYAEIVRFENSFDFGELTKVKIVGIINYDLSEFQKIKNMTWDEYKRNREELNKTYEKLTYKVQGIYKKIFTSNKFVEEIKSDLKETKDLTWSKELIKTGILVFPNKISDYEKLIEKFDSNSSIVVYSSYSNLLENSSDTNVLLQNKQLTMKIIFCVMIFLTITSIILMSKYDSNSNIVKTNSNKLNMCFSILFRLLFIMIMSLFLLFLLIFILTLLFKNNVIPNNLIMDNILNFNFKKFILIFNFTIIMFFVSFLLSVIKNIVLKK